LPVFAGFYRFLPVFSTVLAKILFAMAKSQPWIQVIQMVFFHCPGKNTLLDFSLGFQPKTGHGKKPTLLYFLDYLHGILAYVHVTFVYS
jgi:hypothetical protein